MPADVTERFTVAVRWMGRDGPAHYDVRYREVRHIEYLDEGRLVLKFNNYTLWLFTQHMTSVEIIEET